MTPKKILLMAHDVTLAHLGRPLQLAGHLIADGHDVTLAAETSGLHAIQVIRRAGGRVQLLGGADPRREGEALGD